MEGDEDVKYWIIVNITKVGMVKGSTAASTNNIEIFYVVHPKGTVTGGCL